MSFLHIHGGVMIKAVVHQAQESRPRDLLSWFQSVRKGLGSCNQLNKLTAYFEVIQNTFVI